MAEFLSRMWTISRCSWPTSWRSEIAFLLSATSEWERIRLPRRRGRSPLRKCAVADVRCNTPEGRVAACTSTEATDVVASNPSKEV